MKNKIFIPCKKKLIIIVKKGYKFMSSFKRIQFIFFILLILFSAAVAYSQTEYTLHVKIVSPGDNSTFGKIYIEPMGEYITEDSVFTLPAGTELTLQAEDTSIFVMTENGECEYRNTFQGWDGIWPAYLSYRTATVRMDSDQTLVARYKETGPVCATPAPPRESYVPYLPSPDQVELIPSPETDEMYVDITFSDAGYRVADPGEVAIAAGINPDGTTYMSYITTGTKIERYTGASIQVITTIRITYAIHYGDTTYFGFQVYYNGNDQLVKDTTVPSGPEKTPLPVTPEPTPLVTPRPTPIITPTPDPGTGCTCQSGCDTVKAMSVPFVHNGPGEACFTATSLGYYINSWNLNTLEINGVDMKNRWVPASQFPAPINGKYYIYYKSLYPWGHFEAK
jgi:hypothetical protein